MQDVGDAPVAAGATSRIGRLRQAYGLWAVCAMVVLALWTAGAVAFKDTPRTGGEANGILNFGDEGAVSGWAGSFPPATLITDGWTILSVWKGPVRITAVGVTSTGWQAQIVGYKLREVAIDPDVEMFAEETGFPPVANNSSVGTVDAIGATLDGPAPGAGHPRFYELEIGYRTPFVGKYSRQSVQVTFVYQGVTQTSSLDSFLDLCVPKQAECTHDWRH